MKCDRLSLVKRRGGMKSRRPVFEVSILINGTTRRISRRVLRVVTSLSGAFPLAQFVHTLPLSPSLFLFLRRRVNRGTKLRNKFLRIMVIMRPSKYLTFEPSKFVRIFEEKGVWRGSWGQVEVQAVSKCNLTVVFCRRVKLFGEKNTKDVKRSIQLNVIMIYGKIEYLFF